MKTATTNERKLYKSTRRLFDVLKKILLYTGLIVGGLLLLIVLYQILKQLFVVALLFVAWIFPKRRW